ncbi:hypothetical protein AGOR_G00129060 [Albula goreensis]|uniref:SAM domain-containing protein n=1 Tax=Albula goreensis TaxID=1534307 RepID=A0A8T3DCU8_9TELE|nr:hypothetical protein AGOR_G00129060 [Albula goreensis]
MASGAESMSVSEWLAVLRLEQYVHAFQGVGYDMLSQCRGLTPGDLEQVGVVLPGHQKRILASLQKIFSEGQEVEKPVPRERSQLRPSCSPDSREGPDGFRPAQPCTPNPCPGKQLQQCEQGCVQGQQERDDVPPLPPKFSTAGPPKEPRGPPPLPRRPPVPTPRVARPKTPPSARMILPDKSQQLTTNGLVIQTDPADGLMADTGAAKVGSGQCGASMANC